MSNSLMEMASLRRKISKLHQLKIGLILLFAPLTSNAETFYWYAPVYSAFAKFPSADAAANAVLSVYTDNELDNYSNFSRTTLGYLWDGAYRVNIMGYYMGVQPALHYNNIYRGGDSCPTNSHYDTSREMCVNEIVTAHKGAQPKSLSCDTPSSYKADPINIAIGNEYQEIVDFQLSGSPLRLSRFYNSADGIWRHSYSDHLELGNYSVVLIMSDGREISFQPLSENIFSGGKTEGKIVKNETSWVYYSPTNEQLVFDTFGKLLERRSSTGSKQTVANVDGLITVTDDFGHVLVFKQDMAYQIKYFNFSGFAGTYTYNTFDRLTKFTTTNNGEVKEVNYAYEDASNSNLLTSMADERGVTFASWTYDNQGRATSSRHAGDVEHTTIAYNDDGSATVTNPLGKVTNYQFQTIQGMKRITAIIGEPSANCPNSNSTFTYDEHGLLASKTDAKGFITTYTYNDRGLETTRTEASGTPQARTKTTTWHATFNLPLTVTEGGQVTTYTYDSQGRQTSRTQTAL